MIPQIVDYINSQLRVKNLAADRFANAVFNAIGITQLRSNTSGQYDALPFIFKDGKIHEIAPADSNVLTLWHKNLGALYTPNKQQYGDKNDIIVRTLQLSILVICNLNRILMTAEELELLISDALPTAIPKTLMESLRLTSCVISHQGSNFNSSELYLREFRTPEYKLKPHHQMLEVRYRIECTFRQGCINTCEDCPQ